MKKSILFSIALFAIAVDITAQITVNKSNIISTGQLTVQAYDNTTIYPITTGGANKVWDFTTLLADFTDSISFGQSQWYLGHSNFPGANLASTYIGYDSSYDYYSLSDTAYSYLGTYEVYNGNINISKTNSKLISFPSTNNTTFMATSVNNSGNFEFGNDPDGSGPAPFIDSMSYTNTDNGLSVIDGYGTIKTPLGNFSCLRQNYRTISTISNVKMYTNGSWKKVPANVLKILGWGSKPDTTYTVSFWTNDANVGMPVVNYYYSEGDKNIGSVTWTQTKLQASSISKINQLKNVSSFPNPCHSILTVALPASVKANLTIFDLNGKIVEGVAVENGSTIDISKCENGLYILRYMDSSTGEIIHTQKIIKY